MTEPTLVEQIEKALEEATPGPWVAYFNIHGDPFVTVPGQYLAGRLADVSVSPEDYGKANAHLIAHSPEWLAYLLNRVKEAESARDAARRQATQEYDWRIDLANDVLEQAGDEWDDDTDIGVIAVRYVRHTEAEVVALREALEAVDSATRGWTWGSVKIVIERVRRIARALLNPVAE